MVRYFQVNGVQSLLHDDWVSLDASDSLQLDEYRPLRMYLKYSLFQFITAMMNSSTVGFPKWIYRHNASSLCFGLFKSCKKKKINNGRLQVSMWYNVYHEIFARWIESIKYFKLKLTITGSQKTQYMLKGHMTFSAYI